MRGIDEVRGYKRSILFDQSPGYCHSGPGMCLTGCVVEVVENDIDGRCPMMSLRFYAQPLPSHIAEEMGGRGEPAYVEGTPIGVEICLGPDLLQSVLQQMNEMCETFNRVLREQHAGDSESDA
jgi:hypothetical protein